LDKNSKLPKNPEEWFAGAKYHQDSRWPSREKWVGTYAGGKVPARQPGDGKLMPIEDAPGSFGKVQAS